MPIARSLVQIILIKNNPCLVYLPMIVFFINPDSFCYSGIDDS